MRRLSVVVPFALGLLVQPALWSASAAPQKASEMKETTAETETVRVYKGRLPRYYGKAGVSDQQRQSIYKIQTEYALKIDPLLEQIEDLRQDRDADVADVLTEEQSAAVKSFRAEARKKRSAS